jgi:hypothetical protein
MGRLILSVRMRERAVLLNLAVPLLEVVLHGWQRRLHIVPDMERYLIWKPLQIGLNVVQFHLLDLMHDGMACVL